MPLHRDGGFLGGRFYICLSSHSEYSLAWKIGINNNRKSQNLNLSTSGASATALSFQPSVFVWLQQLSPLAALGCVRTSLEKPPPNRTFPGARPYKNTFRWYFCIMRCYEMILWIDPFCDDISESRCQLLYNVNIKAADQETAAAANSRIETQNGSSVWSTKSL